MSVNKNNGFALLLIGCGALILLGKIGFGLGGLMSFIFPLILIGLGYLGIKNGRSFIGWGLMIFGIIILFGKLTGILGWVIAIGMILYGIHILNKRGRAY